MKQTPRLLIPLFLATATLSVLAQPLPAFRPPAVPLVTHDPYLSIWSCGDTLNGIETAHWTRTLQPLNCMIRINGEAFRLMGTQPKDVKPFPQTSVRVWPTRTVYEFANGKVRATLTFLTPALPSDLDLLSRPLTYLIWDVVSLDGAKHQVELYFDCGPEMAVNTMQQVVEVAPVEVPGLQVLRLGTTHQPVLEKKGDPIRIDWGQALVGIRANPACHLAPFPGEAARRTFVADGRLPLGKPDFKPKSVSGGAPVLAAVLPLGKVGMLNSRGTCHVLLAYDDVKSIRYFSQDLAPYWRRPGADAAWLLDQAEADLADVLKRCEAFDGRFMKDMTRVGGAEYALMTALAYRQTLAGCKLVADASGAPLLFPKENSSNGCIGTTDVIYPMFPFYLFFSPTLAKAALVPVLDYARSPRWPFPFAPHDLGTYPHATGQAYGGGEKSLDGQMPIEETANLLLMVAGLAKVEGNAAFAGAYWPLLETWAGYLKDAGWDPAEQLCTDDFTGPMPHNVNLSAKAICALGAFGQLCEQRGDPDAARRWQELVRGWVDRWVDAAYSRGHYRLAFDQPDTWSQKYNLVWDRFLGLNLFPSNVVREEMDHYLKVQLKYGLPLDSRASFTKLDWIFWTACLTGEREDMDRLLAPAFKFVNETFDRVPMTDWYMADTARRKGFQARSVVGGLFMPALLDEGLRTKWSKEGEDYRKGWAPIPIPSAAPATNAPGPQP
ncbi:MAG: DUF4965 domain-containing protein [Verrucomicrobia bacterium]|jgi:hypothetical protein|nr:DUF4965 domain-containing protein [Verrucomicrobiota bacterium]